MKITTKKKAIEIEWSKDYSGNIIINNILFEQVGEAYPDVDEFSDVYICHNYEASDGSTAITKHPVSNIDAYEDGDYDCCNWDTWGNVDVQIEVIGN